jgi:diguanylate cyclase (GGDEF)-like protein
MQAKYLKNISLFFMRAARSGSSAAANGSIGMQPEADSRMSEHPRRLHRQPIESLATQIILFVFLSTFITALVVSWISIQSTNAYLSGMIDQQYPASLAGARDPVRSWIESGADELRKLARAGGSLDDKHLARALAQSEHFEALVRIASDGSVRHSAGSPGGEPLGDTRSWAGADRLGLQALPTSSGSEVTAYAARLGGSRAKGERLIGVFRAAGIEQILAGLPTGLGQTVLLVDGAGRILHGSGRSTGTVPLTDLLSEEEPAVREYSTSEGIHVIGSSLPLGLSDWHVVVEAPFDVVFEPVVSVIKRIFVIDMCIILLFSFLAYKITAAIVRPIEILSDGARRIAQGQLDLEIPEPSSNDEIGLLTRTFNDMMRKLRGNQAEIEAANAKLRDRNLQLQQANEVLEQLSITDGLTRLHNHRFFHDHLTREIKRVTRIRKPLSMILADIDDFKSLNDRLGHAAGDELLRRIALLMNESIRESDLLARYGGDELVILTSDTDLEGAHQLAEKIRTAIAESSFILEESLRPTRITVSMGVAQYEGNRKRFFAAADRALYRAKAQGKNCVIDDDGT